MRTKIALAIIISGIFSISGIAQCYELVWSEEFDYEGYPNSEIWTPETGGSGFGNNELQYYTGNDLDNAKVENGLLTITAIKEEYGGKSYTSARLITKNKYTVKYGKIEARIKTPYGKGIWPAFWTLGESINEVGWPACGEIDILELVGGGEGYDDVVHGTIHWDVNGHAQYGGEYQLGSDEGIFADDFHTFTVEWTPAFIKWYIDGQQFHVVNITEDHLSEFHEDHFILLNLAVGGNWPGNPDASTVFPQTMNVDYVRVYKKATEVAAYKIEGNDLVAPNATREQFSLPYLPDCSYSWSAPNDALILEGADSNVVAVQWGCTDGSLECTVTGDCSSYNYSKELSISTEIAGPQFIDEYETELTFLVPDMHETTYTWTVPEDVSIVSGKNNDTLKVNWGEIFSPIYLEYSNTCGTETLHIDIMKTGQYAYPSIDSPHKIPGDIEAVNFDFGGKNIAYWDSDAGNSGDGPRQNTDVDTEYGDDGNPTVGWIENGEFLEYSIDVDSSSYYRLDIRAATGNSEGGPFAVLLNGAAGVYGIKVPNTGGWDSFKTIEAAVFEIHETDTVMKLYFNKGGLNLGKMTFTPTTKPASLNEATKNKIILGPVPSSNYINILGINAPAKANIFDINGRLIRRLELDGNHQMIDICNYANGVYMIKISDNRKINWQGKFIKI